MASLILASKVVLLKVREKVGCNPLPMPSVVAELLIPSCLGSPKLAYI
jgi:hypothetical protein